MIDYCVQIGIEIVLQSITDIQLGHMFLPPVVSTPQVPRKMGSPMHEESVFYKYNIQNSNLLAATAAFWTFSQKFMKKAKKIHFLGFFFYIFLGFD